MHSAFDLNRMIQFQLIEFSLQHFKIHQQINIAGTAGVELDLSLGIALEDEDSTGNQAFTDLFMKPCSNSRRQLAKYRDDGLERAQFDDEIVKISLYGPYSYRVIPGQ